jgi:hypothetical protein
MKNITQIKEEYITCPKGHDKTKLILAVESVYCEVCNAPYDIGMKKWG